MSQTRDFVMTSYNLFFQIKHFVFKEIENQITMSWNALLHFIAQFDIK
jgi:hypothetical protein